MTPLAATVADDGLVTIALAALSVAQVVLLGFIADRSRRRRREDALIERRRPHGIREP